MDHPTGSKPHRLEESAKFQELPGHIRNWILESPNAAADFSDFFGNGGLIEPRNNIGLPQYYPGNPPAIFVDEAQWHQLQKEDAPISSQLHTFGTLAHEIGHDRYNTGTVLFTGKTANDYVEYRAELEAQAIFNAFPIFKDLEKNPDFAKMGLPFNSIGYLNGLELGLVYKQWRNGEMDDKAVVEHIAAQVPDRPYTLGDSLQDQNADGRLTHRDFYLSDHAKYIAPKLSPQAPPVHYDGAPMPTASDPSHADRALLEKIREGVRGLDLQIGKPWDERSERLSASALSMAVQMKFNASDDVRVALNNASPTHAAGELLFAYRAGSTASPDPAANLARMPVSEALALPAQERYQQVQATRDTQAETQRQSQPQHENPTQTGLAATR